MRRVLLVCCCEIVNFCAWSSRVCLSLVSNSVSPFSGVLLGRLTSMAHPEVGFNYDREIIFDNAPISRAADDKNSSVWTQLSY